MSKTEDTPALVNRLRAFVAFEGGDLADVEAAADEIERLRAECAAGLDADILAAYSRNDGRREWVSVGTWLRPGEVVAHMDDPRPQQASGATTGYASGTAA